ncbi:hypothetical protein AXX17_AT5G39560 [Arabidopsis thaliana]|uniref:Uncharacterized protein n=1 Tax=Arabidopsis thaliana TaxID=3702 RepID=A0A178UR73_ARATH|nr:hypothetical protein AXX17_AT5G39560 [Arabidopsis thaliana]
MQPEIVPEAVFVVPSSKPRNQPILLRLVKSRVRFPLLIGSFAMKVGFGPG